MYNRYFFNISFIYLTCLIKKMFKVTDNDLNIFIKNLISTHIHITKQFHLYSFELFNHISFALITRKIML